MVWEKQETLNVLLDGVSVASYQIAMPAYKFGPRSY